MVISTASVFPVHLQVPLFDAALCRRRLPGTDCAGHATRRSGGAVAPTSDPGRVPVPVGNGDPDQFSGTLRPPASGSGRSILLLADDDIASAGTCAGPRCFSPSHGNSGVAHPLRGCAGLRLDSSDAGRMARLRPKLRHPSGGLGDGVHPPVTEAVSCGLSSGSAAGKLDESVHEPGEEEPGTVS